MSGHPHDLTRALEVFGFHPPVNLQMLHAHYLYHLCRIHRTLNFKWISQLDTSTIRVPLRDLYVPIMLRSEHPKNELWQRKEARNLPEALLIILGALDATPLPLEEVLAHESRVLITGAPGSGKTTMLKYLTLHLATEERMPLPILIPLGSYAHACTDGDIWRYLSEHVARTSDGVDYAQLLENAIAQGKAVIMLDGLDQVLRCNAHLAEKLETFAREAARFGNRIVLTEHIPGYGEAPHCPTGWVSYTLLDLDRPAIERFITQWHIAIVRNANGDTPETHAAAEAKRVKLLEAILDKPNIRKMAGNPQLLTLLAILHGQAVDLPEHQVELYERYLGTLFSIWRRTHIPEKQPGAAQLDDFRTIFGLGLLVLRLREENQSTASLCRDQVIRSLEGYLTDKNRRLDRGTVAEKAPELPENADDCLSLLLEYIHGTSPLLDSALEEILAANGMVQLGLSKLDDSLAYIQKHLADPGGCEWILFTVGIWSLVCCQPQVAGEIVQRIIKTEYSGANAGKNILIAGACLEEIKELGLGKNVANQVIEALTTTCRDSTCRPTIQAEARAILGRVGWILPDLDDFVPLRAEPSRFGSGRHEMDVELSTMIARYPATNRQYRRFVDADGYDTPEFWTAHGWAWRTGVCDESRVPDYLWSWLGRRPPEKRNEPLYWHDAKWNNPLAPVVGVSWFEVEAYSRWLSKELGKLVSLPTEREWDHAFASTVEREYGRSITSDLSRSKSGGDTAWKDGRDLVLWNNRYSNNTYQRAFNNIVGPHSDTENGCAIHLNVWEWTSSWHDEKHFERTLRGGAWLVYARWLPCCAQNFRLLPDLCNYNVGFRLVTHA